MKRRLILFLLVAVAVPLAIVLWAWIDYITYPKTPPGVEESTPQLTSAVARLQPMNSRVTGTVSFIGREGGVEVRYNLRNVPPGEHWLLVHEEGDCTSSDGSSVGGVVESGNLGSVVANETGLIRGQQAEAEMVDVRGVLGRAVVLHSAGDGADGVGRPIACGVVEIR